MLFQDAIWIDKSPTFELCRLVFWVGTSEWMCAGHGTYSKGCDEHTLCLKAHQVPNRACRRSRRRGWRRVGVQRKREPEARVSAASGNGIAVWQLGIRQRCLERRPPSYDRVPRNARASLPRTPIRGTITESPQAGSTIRGFGETSLQHKAKSSIHLKPNTYTRRSCAQRCVFIPGDLPRCPPKD